jgi:hypothetical protein
MSTFDSANPNECYRRVESVVPQQALALANGDLAIESSRIVARRLSKELSSSEPPQSTAPEFIEAAYEHLLTRRPTSQELEASLKLLEQQRKVFAAVKLVGDEPAFEDGTRPSINPAMRARESLCHALLNCHDFISIP